ncbi:MAG: dienelactone hydrolase family protein [Acidimicrobiia bacterium]|nr:dienelactone hydrolase family protein [Acidimicrobiia bacterium]
MADDEYDALEDFEETDFTHGGRKRLVYSRGTGPAVVVMSEIPGITPLVADFARHVVERGCTVFMPVLFGTPGKPPTGPYAIGSLVRSCVSRDFHALALAEPSPVTVWLRALAADAHRQCGGPGVGAVGMCLTGNFALAMMVDDRVVAPVLSQPSLPFPIGAKRKRDLHISADDLTVVKDRVAQGACVLGLRFTADPMVPTERFERLRQELGDGFISVEIDSSKGNPHGHRRAAHSVLTEDLIDQPGQPSRAALRQVLDFLADRLLTG